MIYESISLPIIFKPNLNEQGYQILDGGICVNNPFQHFNPDETLFIRLGVRYTYINNVLFPNNSHNILSDDKTILNVFLKYKDNIQDIFNNLFSILAASIDQTELESLKGKKYYEIIVDTNNVTTFSFDIKKEKRIELILKGIDAGLKFLEEPIEKIHIPDDETFVYQKFVLDPNFK